ncbi:GNAT family N-acetyltransferase [Nocardia iowensis]|uniref:GNAT family N-acetyltransferase n=1 Tax=Nocardia iowensis TaxID=204891 RepID=A0ABX8RRS0_NOCIO|nr:GNAT family N-acetyltransferase [Nocardia iowensis]QXN92308.1 GNAT family N-acetyltransferase [Nocardia iowensis]
MDAQALSNGTVWLSIPTADDVDAITECCQDPSIGEWVTIPVPYTRENAKTFIDDIVRPGWAGHSPTWALRLFENGPVVGMIGLGERDESAAEIGYWLAPAERCRGLMTQAVNLVCDYGFRPDGMALQRISWRAFVGNYASAAVARRTGFRYEGMARLGSLQRGIRRDHWLAARLPTDPPGPAEGWPAEFDRALHRAPGPR